MANSELKLYYFNSKARAEVSRLILAFAGKMYEDIRISMEDWPNYKPLMPLGKVPALEVDGVKFPQGLAIHYYLAREFGLYPSDHKDQFVIDIVMQSVEELFNVAGRINFTPEGDEKEAKMKEARETQIPPLLTYLEQVLASNGTGYFVGNSLTLADLTAFDVQTGFLSHFIDAGDKYPLLKKNMAIVLGNERIKAYVDNRPDTKY